MKTGFYLTSPVDRHYGAALWAGFWGGNVASFVKWGTENPFPPRTPDRAIPPRRCSRIWESMSATWSITIPVMW